MKGLITRSTGSWYDIEGEDQQRYKGRLKGKFRIQDLKVTNPVAVGDIVHFEIDAQGDANTVVIHDIEQRRNYIIRTSTHKSATGHLIACNVDQCVLVVTLQMPRTSLGFIDRFLVSCEAFRIPAILVFNKQDLYDEQMQEEAEAIIDLYQDLGYQCLITSNVTGKGIAELSALLQNKITLISGHSGAGKSTLINHLIPGSELRTGDISDFSNKGTHTTTFAEMIDMGENSKLIDTPGIKELGIFEIQKEELSHYFPEMRDLLGKCKFHNCQHVNEPKCAVIDYVNKHYIAQSRYQSYLSMLMGDDNRK